LGVQKSFANNKWNMQINVNDLFWTGIYRGEILLADTEMSFANRQPQRNISMRLSYNFGKSQYRAQGRKSGVGEDAARIKK
jgi:hypothetical protein